VRRDGGPRRLRHPSRAAIAKLYNSEVGWRIIDERCRSGAVVATKRADSLRARGEKPVPSSASCATFRINLIFEGSSEIMHLFHRPRGGGKHLQVAGDVVMPGKSLASVRGLVRAGLFYAVVPSRWLGLGFWPKYAGFDRSRGTCATWSAPRGASHVACSTR